MVSGHGNRFQAAKDRIATADNTNDDTQNSNCAELAQIEDSRNIKDIFKYNRTGVQNNRQIQNRIHDNDNQ